MKLSVLGLAATFALVGGSQAAALIDNFESYTVLDSDMNGQGGWIVTNGIPADSVPGPSTDGPVVIVDGYTWDDSDRSATVGGVAQTFLGLTSLSHAVDAGLGGTFADPSSFKFEAAYTESEGTDPRNDFQFVLTSNSGNLLTIDLTPGGAGEYDVSWSSGFAIGGFMGTLAANTSTQFQIDTWWDGVAMAYLFTNAAVPVSTGILTGVGMSETLTSFAVTWDSTGGAGGNSITVDNVSLVPEPLSAFLLGLAGLGFISRRRRA